MAEPSDAPVKWCLDPVCPDRDPALAQRGSRVIVICDEGYQSSLAAATLRRFGVDATDVIGGVQTWIEAGLPVQGPAPDRGDARA